MNIFSQNFELVSENVYATYKIKSAQILNLKTVLGAKKLLFGQFKVSYMFKYCYIYV